MKKTYIFIVLAAHIASTSCMETELTPIYRTNIIQVKKPIIIETQPDIALMEKLHSDTCDLFTTLRISKIINLIAAMNDARNKNIHEDVMGKFLYDKWETTTIEPKEYFKTILFFGYLKHYNQTIKTKPECLPTIKDVIKQQQQTTPKSKPNKLAIMLNLEVPSNKQQITTSSIYEYDSDLTRIKYPAFHTLKSDVQRISDYDYSTFLNYIYSPQKIQKNKYLGLSYIDLKKQFYDTAYYLVTKNKFYDKQKNTCYLFLNIIEAGKTLNPSKQECDFEYDFVNFPQTTLEQYLANNATFTARQYMGILCKLIKQYNDQRTTKITPTKKQIKAYKNKPWDFALPDACDSTLFDKKIYAFNELEKLMSNIETFIYSDDQYKKECVDALYQQKK